ncbi:MAG: hypothetical protein ACI81I_000629 [Arcobacteraceae bacterium]
MKIKLLFVSLLIITSLSGNQNPYILTHDGLIDYRAQDKILQIGDETKAKLGVNLYVDIKEDNGIDPQEKRDIRISLMKVKESKLVSNLPKPYVVLTISINQLYSNILYSDDMKNIIDRDDILDNYVIPLLASKDKNSLFAKTSAATLNGYAQMADSIADSKDITLESSIGSEGKTASSIWKVFMYTIVLTGLILYTVVILKERKFKKGMNSGK